jgi:hypothetical protein
VSVHDLLVSGHRAHAIVRGANGYPIGVSLVKGPGGWRLDASGTAVQAPGHGQRVVVVVNCRWPHAGGDRAALRKGCDAVLATLAVG